MSATFFNARRRAAAAKVEKEEKVATTTVGYLDEKELLSWKKADLQQLARDLGVSDEGTVKELAARCASVEVEVPEE